MGEMFTKFNLPLKMMGWWHWLYLILGLLYRGVLQRPLHKTLVSVALF